MISRTLILTAAALLLVLASSAPSQAQGASAGASGPDGMPPEIAAMLGGAAGTGDVAIAPPSQPTDPQPRQPVAPTAAGTKYLFTSLRVVNNGNPRGCSYANWDCMTNLCKSDLQDNAAWRGWAGCWRDGNNYICYFECGQTRNAF
jgi:hypothetical protein